MDKDFNLFDTKSMIGNIDVVGLICTQRIFL